jgi:hypothetical protein
VLPTLPTPVLVTDQRYRPPGTISLVSLRTLLNARERAQNLQEGEQLAIDLITGPDSSLPALTEPRVGSKELAVVTGQGDEVLLIRATPPPAQEVTGWPGELPAQPEEDDKFVLPALTAPTLLQSNSRPKRARGPTSDYKAMHEGRPIQSERKIDSTP